MESIDSLIAAAIQHQRAGRLVDAERACDRVLAAVPEHPVALHLLGIVVLQQGNAVRARDLLERAVRANPRNHEALAHLGHLYEQAGAPEPAIDCYTRALAIDARFWPAHERLGYVAVARRDFEAALGHFTRVTQLWPDWAPGHNNLGTALGALGRMQEAVKAFERAVALDPNVPDAWLNLAQALENLRRHGPAVAAYQRFLARRPEHAVAHLRIARLLHDTGDWRTAVGHLREALRLDPDYVEARWLLAMMQIPPLYDADDSPAAARVRFEAELQQLDAWFDAQRTRLAPRAVGTMQPFYLAYDESNHRDLLSRYGDLCARIMAGATTVPPVAPAVRSQRRRVAIVCGHVYYHSVWTAFLRGWVAGIDRSRVELMLCYTKRIEDAETAIARNACDAFVTEPTTLDGWIETLAAYGPEVILHSDLGLDPTTARLAALRLAAIQCATWGHPETTGLPTIDRFLSADAFEPPDADAHYAEGLVRLPGIGACYSRFDVPPVDVDFAALGIRENAPIVVCPSTPYKYLPAHDAILATIARRLGRCTIVFFVDIVPELSARLEARITAAFRAEGLRPEDFIRFVPRQPRPEYFAFLRRADVVLDTLGFSGFNTMMQAVECAAPIVTLRGRYMRGRFGSGILEQMGLGDAVSDSVAAYVDRAVQLASDAAANRDLRRRIADGSARVFDDARPVEALSQFLVNVR